MFIPCNYVNGDWILHVYCDQNIASHLHRWMGEFIDQYSVDRINGKYRDWETDRKSTRLNSSHITRSRMPSSA